MILKAVGSSSSACLMVMMRVPVICVYDCNNDDDACIDLRAYDLKRNVIKLKRVYDDDACVHVA